MKLPIILIIAILLVGGIFVELKVRQDHSHSLAANQVTTTTTIPSRASSPNSTLTAEHDACGDIPGHEVASAIAFGVTNKSLLNTEIEVDPDWQKAPHYSGCVWAIYEKGKARAVNAVELFVASFPNSASALRFYRSQTSSYSSGLRADAPRELTLGTRSLFLPLSHNGSGGQINVVDQRTDIRLESVIHSKKISKARSLAFLDHLAKDVLTHLKVG